jgi:iron-sulfur cluster repair protein YtfE (RIC family)
MGYALAKILNQHIKREESALRPYSNRVRAVLRRREHQDHADQHRVLRDMHALLQPGTMMPVSLVVPRLVHLIDELREHMAEEERDIFPTVDRAEAEQPSLVHAPASLITEQMSANAVITQFPSTKPVFEKYGIRCGCDGCDCLDELEWRCGIDAGKPIDELQGTASAGVTPPRQEQESAFAQG